MQRPELESAYATTWTLGEYKWWTGWKRHHWPAEIVQTVSIPLRGRFPQIGFKRLRNNERSDAVHGSIYMDAADLYLERERHLRNHVKIERNPTLRTRAMTLWRQKDRLRCGACRFDFGKPTAHWERISSR